MVSAIEAAQAAARQAIESTYQGVVTVIEHKKVTDPVTKLTDYVDNPVLENQPCKLSFETISAANQSSSAASIAQATKLFLSPDIVIKPNSKLTVTQVGIATNYTSSGKPTMYPTHQEIMLQLFEGWA
jgi:hypothetical protein